MPGESMPRWLIDAFPDAEQWQAEGPHRYSARVTASAYGARPGDWLLVGDDGLRYRAHYVTAQAVERASIDIKAFAFDLIERDLTQLASGESNA